MDMCGWMCVGGCVSGRGWVGVCGVCDVCKEHLIATQVSCLFPSSSRCHGSKVTTSSV